jgi:hypothetical protein
VRVERHADATSFLERARDFLLAREAQHNLILGLAGRLREEPRLYGEDPYFAVALHGERVIGVTMRTPPHNLILSEFDDEATFEPVAENAQDVFGSLPGSSGPRRRSPGSPASGRNARASVPRSVSSNASTEHPRRSCPRGLPVACVRIRRATASS